MSHFSIRQVDGQRHTTIVWLAMSRLLTTILISALYFMAESTTLSAEIVGHRGASHAAPENTLPAFRLAWEEGADGIEGDFYMTRDNRIVCIHDDSTLAYSEQDLRVRYSTLEQLQTLDVGSYKGAQFKGARVPTLEAVLETVPDGKYLLVEVKDSARIVPVLKDVVEKSRKAGQVRVISFDAKVIARSKQLMPEVKAFLIAGQKDLKKWGQDGVLQRLAACKADGIDLQADMQLDRVFFASLRDAGHEIHCWTVNDEKVARHMQSLGVDSMTTDRPAFLRKALGRNGD
jgi:glycerophosphoryl diester phosphodiesterase